MKLFNWDKAGFPPCGLLNCGNRYFVTRLCSVINLSVLLAFPSKFCFCFFNFAVCSCFANVVLQCLSSTRPLVAYLLEKGHRTECKAMTRTHAFPHSLSLSDDYLFNPAPYCGWFFFFVSGIRSDWCFLCEFQTHIERASQSSQAFSPTNII